MPMGRFGMAGVREAYSVYKVTTVANLAVSHVSMLIGYKNKASYASRKLTVVAV